MGFLTKKLRIFDFMTIFEKPAFWTNSAHGARFLRFSKNHKNSKIRSFFVRKRTGNRYITFFGHIERIRSRKKMSDFLTPPTSIRFWSYPWKPRFFAISRFPSSHPASHHFFDTSLNKKSDFFFGNKKNSPNPSFCATYDLQTRINEGATPKLNLGSNRQNHQKSIVKPY